MTSPAPRLALLLPFLALGQITGWGTTYYLPSVLGPSLTRDLGFGSTEIYLGVTIMVAIGGLASPIAGRSFDRLGAARFLPIAPLAIGLGHLLFAGLPSVATWYAAWALFGLAMGFGLTLAVNTFLTRVVGRGVRERIGILALLVGFAPTLFWPLTAMLEAALGWRGAVALYGAALKRHYGRGGSLAWGIVPTSAAIREQSVAGLAARYEGLVDHLAGSCGIDRALILERTVVTPSCGTGSMEVADAERVFSILGELSRALKSEHGA